MIKDIKAKNDAVQPSDRVMAKLHADFPQCFTNEGKFDLEKFKSLLNDKVDVTEEGYDLNFLGKNYANLIASTETETVIQPDLEHNSKPENKDSQNIYISGDNLDALKHLLKSYAGKIKCIYIDPPYNTGSDGFVYNDKFNFTAEQLQTKLGIGEEKAKRILDLCKRGSASHSAWLMFMAPRLMLARDLLTEDGVIFISIDNNEQANLRLLCDSVLGEENFCECFLWNKTSTPPALSKKSRKTHEFVLCYQKYKNAEKFIGLVNSEGDSPLLNGSNKECTLTFPMNYVHTNLKDGVYYKGVKDRVELLNDVIVANGLIKNEFSLKGKFRWSQETLNEEIAAECFLIVKSEKFAIRYCRVDDRVVAPQNFLADRFWNNTNTTVDKECNGVDTNESAGKEIEELFGSKVFDFPKPSTLISYLISFVVKQGDIVLDFFSGSGTSAHAVFRREILNKIDLRFILVQLPENLDDSLSRADDVAKETISNAIAVCDEINKPHLLDEIGQERIRRAAAKIRQEHPEYKGDLGFKHFTLRDVPQNTLDKMETFDLNGMFGDTDILKSFGKETVLATWMVKDGYGLTQNAEPLQLADYTAYHCGGHIYMIEGEGFDEKAMIALVDKYGREPEFNPHNVVLFGYSFTFTQTEMLKKNLSAVKKLNERINIDIRY